MLSVIARPATRAVAISGVRGAGDCFSLDKLGVAMTRVSMLDAGAEKMRDQGAEGKKAGRRRNVK